MKRYLAVAGLVLLIVSLALTGCSDKTDLALARIQAAGVITVGTSPDYPPYETIDDEGNIIGFDIDLINAMAAEMGLQVQLKSMIFENIVTAVQTGQVDIGVSGFSIDPERQEQVDFTDPYFSGGQVVVAKPDSGITEIEDLVGKVVATQMATTCADAAEQIEGIDLKLMDDFNIAWNMLKTGAAQAVVADIAVAKEYVAREGYVQIGEPLSFEETAIIAQKGNPSLLEALNNALQQVKDSGKYDELVEQWGLLDQ